VEVGRPLRHWCAALAQTQRGRVAKDRGAHEVAVQLMEDGLAMARDLDFDMGIALALDFLATVALVRNDVDGAYLLAEESLRHYRAIAYEEGIASALQTLGRVALRRGDHDASRAAFGEVLQRCHRAGHPGGAAGGLEGIAVTLASQDRSLDAVQLFATASRLRRQIGDYAREAAPDPCGALLPRLQHELGSRFDVAWNMGASLHLDDAIDLALGG
jgi:tetratricopeptide (TPR) repeat protein